ncbi:3-oxoacyl-ACP reductase [Anopheles sinensis]|uniref:3-oxoacyl-ACP reductase n=1 Tax=Anopheles sinensis TaxID=74873 RepID=A0A084WHA7_ANOSI|nr:3-oxoacyl-ACP reductase [Anopheles sinensis]
MDTVGEAEGGARPLALDSRPLNEATKDLYPPRVEQLLASPRRVGELGFNQMIGTTTHTYKETLYLIHYMHLHLAIPIDLTTWSSLSMPSSTSPATRGSTSSSTPR